MSPKRRADGSGTTVELLVKMMSPSLPAAPCTAPTVVGVSKARLILLKKLGLVTVMFPEKLVYEASCPEEADFKPNVVISALDRMTKASPDTKSVIVVLDPKGEVKVVV